MGTSNGGLVYKNTCIDEKVDISVSLLRSLKSVKIMRLAARSDTGYCGMPRTTPPRHSTPYTVVKKKKKSCTIIKSNCRLTPYLSWI